MISDIPDKVIIIGCQAIEIAKHEEQANKKGKNRGEENRIAFTHEVKLIKKALPWRIRTELLVILEFTFY